MVTEKVVFTSFEFCAGIRPLPPGWVGVNCSAVDELEPLGEERTAWHVDDVAL